MRRSTALEHGHQHAEAFCVMSYRCENCLKVEWLWNSRDGVTPYIIISACCEKATAPHVNFHRDQYAPGHQPHAGQRVFVDQTPEGYREAWRANIEHNWEAVNHPMRDRFASKAEALRLLSESFQRGSPTIKISDGKGGYR